MGLLLSGRQMREFFHDPRYWGRGQSFQNLGLKVNSQFVGSPQFDAGWDVEDLADDDIVEVIEGTWVSRGCVLGTDRMPEVVECWLRGIFPVEPLARPLDGSPLPMSSMGPVESHAQVKRPSFSLR